MFHESISPKKIAMRKGKYVPVNGDTYAVMFHQHLG